MCDDDDDDDPLVGRRRRFLKSADESDRDSMLAEADMARSLDALGWTKVGMCVYLCSCAHERARAYLCCFARKTAVAHTIRRQLYTAC